jgi:glycosyltransferase involved in cell wall biosynthesis
VPFFSIIVPTFNSAKAVHTALDSILQQTFTDFEVIFMDGKSKDNTIEIINNYCDSRTKVFSEPDKGVFDAMNKGVKKSCGNWIYFLGSDDSLYDENVLADVSAFLGSGNYDVAYGDVVSARFEGVYGGIFDADKLLKQNICHQSIFFRRSVFKKVGNFNVHYKTQADWDYNFKWFFAKNVQHVYLNRIIARYADGGLSSNGDPLFEMEKFHRYLLHSMQALDFKSRFNLLRTEFLKAYTARSKNNMIEVLKIGFKTLL